MKTYTISGREVLPVLKVSGKHEISVDLVCPINKEVLETITESSGLPLQRNRAFLKNREIAEQLKEQDLIISIVGYTILNGESRPLVEFDLNKITLEGEHYEDFRHTK